jgi:DNA-binding transcriptional ArsR family regulator
MTSEIEINTELMQNSADAASKLLKTLSHKDRLMILCQLQDTEKSVGELANILNIPQSPLSQHLARMRNEGLVKTRRESQTIYYSLDCDKTTKVIEALYSLFCEVE